MRFLKSLREIADRYDGFILDLWGLIHDGETPYPPAAATLAALRDAGKTTLLLSNAPRRAYALIEAMNRMGLARDLYGQVLSSGEATHEALKRRADPFFAALGARVYHLGPARDRSVFDDTGLEIVPDLAAAQFVVNTGPVSLDDTVADYQPVLGAARAANLPMVCANPDHVVIRGGKPIVCAGALAARYESMGGSVAWLGKPDPKIYRLAVSMLGADPKRIAVVGDALETDVKGAHAAGLDAVWCTGGIHAEALGVSYGVAADPRRAHDLAKDFGHVPAAAIPGFIW
ncbi:MAG: TIGR01459 family HAD-type hydrolase [Rhodospirillaceae bacterium]|nr:TIGR01459 family HAD-type hydrolase [Rhodospirillaceae bacterium]